MIKEIENSVGVEFQIRNKSWKYKINPSNSDFWLGYYVGDELVGVLSAKEFKDKVRIKSMILAESHRNKGIGYQLFKYAQDNYFKGKMLTGYWIESSYPIGKKLGWELVSEKNGIKFMRCFNE